ncbi:hypothetical protein Trco_006014 [Trichoderma cornu-damae]|uniref:Uncharacterized protein n=1 Tax=Trichoderma cornu-damae TaxID=654480 RepID=A0A9P8TT28_9HYPO|nr:hypothetical protein Trco_006014 [Trichoderma cornu-damae]
MSKSNDAQNHDDDDFMDTWQADSMEEMNFGGYASSGNLVPTVFSDKMPAEELSEMDLGTLGFLTATDTHGVDATIEYDDNFGLDLPLNWIPYTSDRQLSSNPILNHGRFYPENVDRQFLPFHHQTPAFGNDPGQDFRLDYPLSAYPPLDLDDAANSLPYGHPVIQQSRQILPSATQNLDIDSFGFTQNAQSPSGGRQRGSSGSSRRMGKPSPENRKVNLNRAAKQRGDPSCDPSLCYSANPGAVAPWGSMTWNGQHLFSYTPKGQWLRDRCFDKRQFREYVDNCGKETVFWVQQAPTQCNHRLDPEDRICRWANCPVSNRTITAGWLRVAFDEFPHLTSNGSRDPLKCAGSLHLWCFEQIFDPAEFHLSGRLRPEDRQFPFEDKSVVTLEKLTDAGIIREAYQPWFAQSLRRLHPHVRIQPAPREYRETLSYRLNKYHLDNQTAARQKARSKRNNSKSVDERRTIDVHLGDLKMFVDITNKARRSKKSRKLRKMKAEGDADMNSPEITGSTRLVISPQLWPLSNAQSAGDGTQNMTAAWYPELHRAAPSTHGLQSRSLQEASAYRAGRGCGRQPALPQLTSDPRARFNMATRAQARRALRPLITQPQQQQPFSGAAVPLKTEQQQQSGLLSGDPNSQFETQGSVSIKRDPDETSVFARPSGEALELLGSSSGAQFLDSHRGNSLSQGDMDIGHLIDPRLFGNELGINRGRNEAANNILTTHALMDFVGGQALGLVDCALSPQAAAASKSWDGLDHLMDDVDFGGGFGGADASPLFDDFSATNGVDGESRNSC